MEFDINTVCKQCNGEGRIRNVYRGIDIGEKRCYRCKGNGVEPST